MSDSEPRKLSDLRVVQLRAELEKRGLDKTGVKQVLVERLQKALIDEGVDPEVHNFDMNDKKQKTVSTPLSNPDNEDYQNEEPISDRDVEQSQPTIEEKENEVLQNKDGEGARETRTVESKTADSQTADNQTADSQTADNQTADSQTAENQTAESENTDSQTAASQAAESQTADGQTAQKENTASSDEKKSTKDVPETPEDTSEIKPTEQDVKKDEKSSGENSEAADAAATATVPATETVATTATDTASTTTTITASGGATKVRSVSDSQNRNLWITNISQNTRATELKQALSAYGKVIGAKVVINARYPGACCYGYVKMETVEDANNCISKLNNTELNGQIIRIEKVRPEHLNPNLNINKNRLDGGKSKPKFNKPEYKFQDESRSVNIVNVDELGLADPMIVERPGTITDNDPHVRAVVIERSRSADRRSHDRHRKRSRSRDRTERSMSSKSRRRDREMVLTFDKIKDERDRERVREKERLIREEKRRREEAVRQREIERRQRSEAQRLEREREKLRIERERLERERADLMLLERERQKLEREKLELEKLELERVKMRIQEEERRKRPAPYGRDRSYEDRKRGAPSDRHFEEAPPPPRFDTPASGKTQQPSPASGKFKSSNKGHGNLEKVESFSHKRDSRHYEGEPHRSHSQSSSGIQQRSSSQSMGKYNSEVFSFNREREIRDPSRGGREGPGGASASKYTVQVTKEQRYVTDDRDRSPHFRGGNDRDRRQIADHKSDMRSSRDHRYDPPKEAGRFDRSSGGGGGGGGGSGANLWGGHSSQSKVFNSNNANSSQKGTWVKETWRQSEASGNSERWNTGGSRNGPPLSTGGFSNNSNMMNMGPSCPPPPGINNYVTDRYEYKGNIGYIRK